MNLTFFEKVGSDLLFEKRFQWARHLAFIAMLTAIFFFGDKIITIKVGENNNIFIRGGFFIMLLGVFYLNYFFLIPRFILKHRYVLYSILQLSVYTLIFGLMMIIERLPGFKIHTDKYLKLTDFFGFSLLLTIYVMAIATLQLLKSRLIHHIRYSHLENYSLKLRLNQLENQINPHFLFNMLNNIHLLMGEDPQKADTMLIHLSDILRHQLYDTSNEYIPLQKEVDVLKSILQLEQLRRENYNIDVKLEGKFEHLKIPPHMFIPFVENAIKHGRNSYTDSINYDIKIVISVIENSLLFFCSNPIGVKLENRSGGIGLKNIHKRLEILFPDKHELNICQGERTFDVKLKIPTYNGI